MLLGIDPAGSPGDHHGPAHGPEPPSSSSPTPAHKGTKTLLVALERTALTLLSVAVSVLVPEFASVMAVLGSTFSFVLCIIGPVCAKVALAGGVRRCGAWDALVLAVSGAMAVWGTVCAFATAEVEPL